MNISRPLVVFVEKGEDDMPTDHTPFAQAELRDVIAKDIVNGVLGAWGKYQDVNKEKLAPMWRKAYEVADCGMEVRNE